MSQSTLHSFSHEHTAPDALDESTDATTKHSVAAKSKATAASSAAAAAPVDVIAVEHANAGAPANGKSENADNLPTSQPARAITPAAPTSTSAWTSSRVVSPRRSPRNTPPSRRASTSTHVPLVVNAKQSNDENANDNDDNDNDDNNNDVNDNDDKGSNKRDSNDDIVMSDEMTGMREAARGS